jgi:hypothetical protein
MKPSKKDEAGRFLKRKRTHPPPEVDAQQQATYAAVEKEVPAHWPDWMLRPELLPRKPPGRS